MNIPIEILVVFIGLIGGFFFKVLFDWIKGDKKKDDDRTVHICPLDREGYVTILKDVKGIGLEMRSKLDICHSDLQQGISVAKRNTNHYEEFVKVLAELMNASKTQTKLLEEIKDYSKKQTEQLIKISRNGGG